MKSQKIIVVNWLCCINNRVFWKRSLIVIKINPNTLLNFCQCHTNSSRNYFVSGYRTRAKMEDDRITLIHAVEIYRSIYTAPWFQGKGHFVSESNICYDFIPSQ